MRRVLVFAFIALAIFFFSGCLSKFTGPSDYTAQYTGNWNATPIHDEALIEECKLGECKCFSCKNSTSWFGFVKSLKGGYCHFLDNCTRSKFMDLINQSDSTYPDEGPRQFMIGQGYSFSDFAQANPWCGNRLDMPVQWLVGDNDTPYSLPDSDRAECMLEFDKIPVYVLYSKGQNINASRALQIAQELRGVGPVIITTEIDFNSSDSNVLDNISDQIDKINEGCQNVRIGKRSDWNISCMVALAPKMGDYKAVEEILDTRKQKDNVDLIAFGINSHLVNLNDTNDANCNPDMVYLKALSFARYSLYNHSLPTVIPYIMFDAAGSDASGKCNWTETNMVKGYARFFPGHALTFQKAGVIGVAPYDFNSSQYGITNPLGCLDCALGANDARMAAWFASCKAYKLIAGKNGGDNMMVFSNGSGVCDYNVMGSTFLMQYDSYLNAVTPNLSDKNASYIRCDACVNENVTFPFDVPKTTVVTAATNFTYCENYSMIEFFSGKRNIDPMLIRALIIAETKFDPCLAAPVKSAGGLDPGCYPKAYDYVPDPDKICNSFETKVAGTRYCAIGMMQTLVPPYEFWPAIYYPADKGTGPLYYQISGDYLYYEANVVAGRSGNISTAISECSNHFNPFNATHSICLGTYQFSQNLVTATAIVTKNKDALNADTSSKQRALSYYIALHYYRGYSNYVSGWISQFSTQKKYDATYIAAHSGESDADIMASEPAECRGQTDFIYYVRECRFKIKNDLKLDSKIYTDSKVMYGDYASRVLSYYLDLSDKCASAGCPSWKKLATATSSTTPTSWPPPPGEVFKKKTT